MSAPNETEWQDRDDEFEIDEPTEQSDGLGLSKEDFSNLVIAPADWTIETLYRQIGNQIDLNPDFQRRNVWNKRAKSSFIESLFLGIPIPQILLSAKIGEKSSFLVLDGKQRLTAIKEFIDGKFLDGTTFKLSDLRILHNELHGKSWDVISKDPEWSGRLLNETQRTAVLRGWQDDPVLYEIFYRLNSGSVRLSPMELRMSLYPGDFLKFVIRWTETIGPLHNLLNKKSPDNRMGDVELAVRFLAFQDNEIKYQGDLKKFLDETCIKYNQKFSDTEFKKNIEDKLSAMNSAVEAGIAIFGRKEFCRKFINDDYETRFNRAIYDILVGTLSNPEARNWSMENKEAFKTTYETLSMSDNEFIRSLETTTKSLEATRSRFSKWYFALKGASGIDVPAVGALNG